MQRISILGATGSIGQQALDLIRRDPNRYQIVALTGGWNVAQLARDAIEFKAEMAVTCHAGAYAKLKGALAGTGIEVAVEEAGLIEAARRPADIVVSAIVGAAGLAPGWAAAQEGVTLALANKETLVCAGPIFMDHARVHGTTVLPVDSEHSAVFQALLGEDIAAVERVIITASGGAFRDWPMDKLAAATPQEAASHPNWDMGQRITIDSASMFNKALEVIETREFFDVAPEQIEVLVHPESLVHALVGFRDGALMAHIGPHDMRHAIGFALAWPERRDIPVERLDLSKIGALNFAAPDLARYPALALAQEVMAQRGHAGAVFNAAKEVALDGFISGGLGFLDMARVVEATLDAAVNGQGLDKDTMSFHSVIHADGLARKLAQDIIANQRF